MIDPPDPPPEPVPPPHERRKVNRIERPIALVAVLGGGIALICVVGGLVFLGAHDNADEQISSTGLASIGATLAGAFAAWLGRNTSGGGDR